jgi:citrate synthase
MSNKVFWRKEPLNHFEQELLSLCLTAHQGSAVRDNISTHVLVNAAKGSLNYLSSLSAALCSVGGVHAPIPQATAVLCDSMENIALAIEMGAIIPGWGSDLILDEIDPLWVPVANHIENHFPQIHERLEGITMKFHEKGKMIYPNPSAYTAATGMALGIPAPIIPWLFVHGRLIEWTSMFYNTLVQVSPKAKVPQQPQPEQKPEKEAVS